jgi:elongation factor Ts
MGISAKQVKELRDSTGAGMMACKKALIECDGNIDEATDYLKKKGIADSQKRANRSASEGVTIVRSLSGGKGALLLELNCETDFVARNESFVEFANSLADFAAETGDYEAASLLKRDYCGIVLEEKIKEQSSKTGEKLVLSRVGKVSIPENSAGGVGHYIHDGGKIGVVVAMTTATSEDTSTDAFNQLVKDLAMHVAACSPVVVSDIEIPAVLLNKEKEIFLAQAAESGKPPEIAEKIVTGRLNKWKKEISLLDQPFVKNPDVSVEGHVASVSKEYFSGSANVCSFLRYRVGEA